MCWFVTLAVPDAVVAVLDRVGDAHRGALSLQRLQDTPTTRVFPHGATCVEVTAGGCSCGLYESPGANPGTTPDRERAKLVAKGWSHAKVERALAAKADSAARPQAADAGRADFKAFVSELLAAAGTVHLHAHFHSGNQRTADVAPVQAATLSLEQFLHAGFAPDTLVTLRR